MQTTQMLHYYYKNKLFIHFYESRFPPNTRIVFWNENYKDFNESFSGGQILPYLLKMQSQWVNSNDNNNTKVSYYGLLLLFIAWEYTEYKI